MLQPKRPITLSLFRYLHFVIQQWLTSSLAPLEDDTFCFVEPKKVSYRHLVSVGSPFGSWIIASGNFPEQPLRCGPGLVGSDDTVLSDLHKRRCAFLPPEPERYRKMNTFCPDGSMRSPNPGISPSQTVRRRPSIGCSAATTRLVSFFPRFRFMIRPRPPGSGQSIQSGGCPLVFPPALAPVHSEPEPWAIAATPPRCPASKTRKGRRKPE
jgi:hypothetical protein